MVRWSFPPGRYWWQLSQPIDLDSACDTLCFAGAAGTIRWAFSAARALDAPELASDIPSRSAIDTPDNSKDHHKDFIESRVMSESQGQVDQ